MSERLFEMAESNTVEQPVIEIQERVLYTHTQQLRLQIGSYATALVKGDVAGLIGSDIFPDDGEGL